MVKCVNYILKAALWCSFIKKSSFYTSKTTLWCCTEPSNCGWSGGSLLQHTGSKNKTNQGKHTLKFSVNQNLEKGLHSSKYMNGLNVLSRAWLSLYTLWSVCFVKIQSRISKLKWLLHCKPMQNFNLNYIFWNSETSCPFLIFM